MDQMCSGPEYSGTQSKLLRQIQVFGAGVAVLASPPSPSPAPSPSLFVCSWVWLLVPPETHLKFISSSPAVIKAWSLHRSSARLLCHAQWLHLCSCWPSVFYLSVQGSRVLFASCSCCSVFSTAGRRLTPVCFPLLVCRSSVSLCSAVLLSPSGWFDWLWAVAACFSGFLFVRSFVPFTVVEDNFLIVITFITKCCDWEWLRPEKIRKEKCIWIQSLQHFLFCFWVHFTSVLCAKHIHPLLAS